jgi:hypothetical protein
MIGTSTGLKMASNRVLITTAAPSTAGQPIGLLLLLTKAS